MARRDDIDRRGCSPSPVDTAVSFGNGKVLFGLEDGVSDNITLRSGFIADDLWHHVSARRIQSSGEITLFVDGVEMGRAIGSTESLNGTTLLKVAVTDALSQPYIGAIDQLRIWNTPRSDEQIAADYHLTRSTHGLTDEPPVVRIDPGQNSVQVFWDAISGYRVLEGATTVDGSYVTLPTDQNSTNIIIDAGTRYFRVRR